MRKYIVSISILVVMIVLLFATSLLLDLQFIQERIVRQIVVYILMVLIVLISFKIDKEIS
jgi:hypothetical protein